MTSAPSETAGETRGRSGRPRGRRFGLWVAAAIAAGAVLPLTDAAAQTTASTMTGTAGQTGVTTTTGTFTPVTSPTNSAVNVFYGIRYAAAPEGSLRWMPPTAPTPPSGTVSASTPGDACPQEASTSPLDQSEDCLFLNVWVPAHVSPNAKLPVFFWIHGGALIEGTGANYDPSAMVANSNIIVVTINYRLGALGWLAQSSLLARSSNSFQNSGDGGDYGLMDQQFALQWVQCNIANFGGDPTKVTIGGESAGGLSVGANLASTDTASGLFRAAIIESGSYMLHDLPSLSTYESDFGNTFADDVGCTLASAEASAAPSASTESSTSTTESTANSPARFQASCLRSASVENILTAQGEAYGASGISPDSGTKILPNSLFSAFTNGEFLNVPVLEGTNANEGRLFEPDEITGATIDTQVIDAGGPANFDLTNANEFCESNGQEEDCTYQQEISSFLTVLGIPSSVNTSSFDSALASEYPLANFPDPFLTNDAPSSDEALAQIFTDLVFACNGLDQNNLLSQFTTLYAYEFNDPNAPPTPGFGTTVEAPNDVNGFPTASEHGSELQYLFNLGANATLSTAEQQLSSEMQTYWGNFIVSNNPNSSAVATWPAYTSSNSEVQDLVPGPTNPSAFTTFSSEHFCSTWEPLLEGEE
jgi:para-nitrobenzyl esterase